MTALPWLRVIFTRSSRWRLRSISCDSDCFAPLMLFKCTAKTATVTDRDNLLCLCNFNFIPRNVARVYKDALSGITISYSSKIPTVCLYFSHLNTALVEKLLCELVVPFRKLRLSDEEIVCLCAVIVLNPSKVSSRLPRFSRFVCGLFKWQRA